MYHYSTFTYLNIEYKIGNTLYFLDNLLISNNPHTSNIQPIYNQPIVTNCLLSKCPHMNSVISYINENHILTEEDISLLTDDTNDLLLNDYDDNEINQFINMYNAIYSSQLKKDELLDRINTQNEYKKRNYLLSHYLSIEKIISINYHTE